MYLEAQRRLHDTGGRHQYIPLVPRLLGKLGGRRLAQGSPCEVSIRYEHLDDHGVLLVTFTPPAKGVFASCVLLCDVHDILKGCI